MWRSPVTGLWTLLTADVPTLMQGDADGNVWAVFDASDMKGLWQWSLASGSWTQVNAGTPTQLTVLSNNSVFITFSSPGLWVRNPVDGQWRLLSTSDPVGVAG
jgi:hypothetical protein